MPTKTDAVRLEKLRMIAGRLMDDRRYYKEIELISETTLGDAANKLNKDLNHPDVIKLAEEMVIGRLLVSAGDRLSLGQMKAGACDCCKWEVALA